MPYYDCKVEFSDLDTAIKMYLNGTKRSNPVISGAILMSYDNKVAHFPVQKIGSNHIRFAPGYIDLDTLWFYPANSIEEAIYPHLDLGVKFTSEELALLDVKSFRETKENFGSSLPSIISREGVFESDFGVFGAGEEVPFGIHLSQLTDLIERVSDFIYDRKWNLYYYSSGIAPSQMKFPVSKFRKGAENFNLLMSYLLAYYKKITPEISYTANDTISLAASSLSFLVELPEVGLAQVCLDTLQKAGISQEMVLQQFDSIFDLIESPDMDVSFEHTFLKINDILPGRDFDDLSKPDLNLREQHMKLTTPFSILQRVSKLIWS